MRGFYICPLLRKPSAPCSTSSPFDALDLGSKHPSVLFSGHRNSVVNMLPNPLLHALQVMTTVCSTFDSACLFPIKNADMNHVCPAFICPWDRNPPLDMTALSAADRLILWQPWSHQDGKLHKQAPQPATPGSGAAMDARHLRLLFLQAFRWTIWMGMATGSLLPSRTIPSVPCLTCCRWAPTPTFLPRMRMPGVPRVPSPFPAQRESSLAGLLGCSPSLNRSFHHASPLADHQRCPAAGILGSDPGQSLHRRLAVHSSPGRAPVKRWTGYGALQEMVRPQLSTRLLLLRRPFERLVRAILRKVARKRLFIQAIALQVLQEAAEAILVAVLQGANALAQHSKRVTLMDRDMAYLLQSVRRDTSLV